MRVAYLECFSGISGDMMLGALLAAGVSEDALQHAVAALNIGAELRVSRVDRSGISATKVDVIVNGTSADQPHSHNGDHSHQHNYHHHDDHAHDHPHSQRDAHGSEHGHHHQESAAHDHQHGRSLSAIREIILNANIPDPAREIAIRAFEQLGEAEAGIHCVPVESIHFHEVGAVDAIVDIVGSAVGCHSLGVDQFICSPLNVGGGTVKCAHGEFPVPAPATLSLLKSVPVYSTGADMELVTPTGAALVRALGCRFSAFPMMSVEAIGYGAGSRNPHGRPNVMRISVGELIEATKGTDSERTRHDITVLETTIDDLSPQVMGYVTERLLAEGAVDVFVTPAQMKKNRPGVLLTVLCDENAAQVLREILFRETSTIGIRSRQERRDCLDRVIVPISTEWGTIHVKESRLNGTVTNFAPEYEDCRRIAEAKSIPLKEIQQQTISAYLEQREQSASIPDEARQPPKYASTKSQVA